MYTVTITDVMHFTEQTMDKCEKLRPKFFLQQIHVTFCKVHYISIANDGKHIEDFILIKIKINKKVFCSLPMCADYVSSLHGHHAQQTVRGKPY